MKKRIVLPILLAALVISPPAHAQTDCATQLNGVIASLANVCANLDAGQACVAHERVVATIEGPPAAIAFSQPDDRAAFADIRNMQTSPFDAFTGAWGVALIRPSAGPSTLLMTGGVQLDNHSTAPDSLDIGVLTDTASEPGCAEALPGFTVYVPAGSHVDLTLNGAGMALDGALVTARQQTLNSMTLAVFQGQVAVSGGPVAGSGQTLVAVTDNAGTIAFWSAPRLHTEQETRQATIVSGALDAMLHTGMVASACSQPIIHVVQRGEWIYSIARQYGVSPQVILNANALQDPNLLYAGQELVIPCAEGQPALASATPVEQAAAREVFICPDSPRHRVARGETLYGIALRYGVPVDDIAAANRLVSPGVIYEGQELIIPCGVDSGATAPAPADAEQPEDAAAQPPNEDVSPSADFCQQDFSSAPPDLQQFINSLCNP